MTTENQLVEIQSADMNGELVQTVNARDLHRSLEIGKDFSTWTKDQLVRAGLEEGTDYLLTQKGEQVPHQGGARSVVVTDYHFTVDAAKHIALMSNTEKGKETRKYFIQVEKDHQKLVNQAALETQLTQLLIEAKPEMRKQVKAEYHEQCLHSPEYELGQAMIKVMQDLEDRRNKANLDAAVRECSGLVAQIAEKFSVGLQTLLSAVSKAWIDTQAKARDKRGEHLSEQEEAAKGSFDHARAVAADAIAEAQRLAQEKFVRERVRPMTLEQILAKEEAEMYDRIGPRQGGQR